MQRTDSVFGLAASVRQSRGITLEQIGAATRIRLWYLQEIENGRFENLPGGVYNLNYVRQYARAIDFDESALVAAYRRLAGPEFPPEPDPSPVRTGIRARLAGLLEQVKAALVAPV